MLTAIPRAGTHLGELILTRLTGRVMYRLFKPDYNIHYKAIAALVNSQLRYRSFSFLGHIRYNPKEEIVEIARSERWAVIVLVRDPRDVILSLRDALMVTTSKKHANAFAHLKERSRAEQIRAIADGIPNIVVPASRHFRGWVEWSRQGATLIRYEDLISGHASRDLAACLGLARSSVESALQDCVGRETITLNRGKPGRWISEMKEAEMSYLCSCDDGFMAELGYSW